eukprot:CCRYP_017906-RA/>CCRYP_017906-RA protein AED:0.35 eAED:0.35 QI:0/-1/0/1/-1/1/1/0/717
MDSPDQVSSTASRLPHRHVVLFYRYFLPTDHHAESPNVQHGGSVQISADGSNFGVLDTATLHFFQNHSNHYLPLLQRHQIALCERLGDMKGRILISIEGINGTLSGCGVDAIMQYTKEMENFDLLTEFVVPEKIHENSSIPKPGRGRLFANIDWKISDVNDDHMSDEYHEPFPDLKVQIVNEIVNTGGTIHASDISEHMGKEISPDEFHSILTQAQANGGWVAESDLSDDGPVNVSDNEGLMGSEARISGHNKAKKKEVVLVDVRNTFEHAIGHFIHPHSNTIIPHTCTTGKDPSSTNTTGNTKEDLSLMQRSSNSAPTPAINPNTVTFSHFDSNFCSKYSNVLKDKKVLMYCTGGIRCVKASAMLKKRGIEDVSHLSGGIHRYLEKYSSDGFYKGKCMVFDQRVALDPDSFKTRDEEDSKNRASNIVGKCIECQTPYDQLSGANLCTVCRDLILICPTCRESKHEYHCDRHQTWKNAYFTFLEGFTCEELENQKSELQRLHDSYSPPKEHKNVRKTLRKQIEKVLDRLNELEIGSANVDTNARRRCRTCFESDAICDGLCWGFWKHSQSRHQQHDDDKLHPIHEVKVGDRVTPGPNWNEMRLGSKFLPSTFTDSKKAKTGLDARVHTKLQNNQQVLKKGTVVQIKSWGSGGRENDCVAVLWDEFLQHGRRKKNGRVHYSEPKDRDETLLHQAEIYRWGAKARNGQRMYDVKLIHPC